MTTLAFDEKHAIDLDGSDDLPTLREQFHLPRAPGGRFTEAAYFAGNSLGLQPKVIAARLTGELDDWARLGVEGHVGAARPWVSYHELLRAPAARLVGAQPALGAEVGQAEGGGVVGRPVDR